jgi:hypothetical protein
LGDSADVGLLCMRVNRHWFRHPTYQWGDSMMNWSYFLLGIVAYQIIKMLIKVINNEVIEYRHRRFLRLVNVEFPDHSDITFVVIDTSDKRAMKKLEAELRERYELE